MRLIWVEINRLKEKGLFTLDRRKPFKILELTEKSIVIEVSTGKTRPIPRSHIEEAWQELETTRELTRAKIREAYSDFNPAYVAAILAALPEVKYTIKPIKLYI